ncbi:MAG: hypothetical protein V4722_28350 [Bacteroidota bacterium]
MNFVRRIAICSIAFLCFGFSSFSQKWSILNKLNELVKAHKDDVFILCRGTRLKTSIISRQFNLSDSAINHVAVGFVENDQLLIFNVSDLTIGNSAITKETLKTFVQSSDVYCLSIWRLKTNRQSLEYFKKSCYDLFAKKIVFDAQFNLRDDDTLYCSEFSARMLNTILNEKDAFIPQKKVLNKAFYIAYLQRQLLTYYPVDFFLSNKNVQLLYKEQF